LNYIKAVVLADIGDASSFVRQTISVVLTTIVSEVELETWPELLPALAQHLDNPDQNFVHGAFNALDKICEDSAPKMVREQQQS
jgi:transportin-1